MKKANFHQIKRFKEQYCHSASSRKRISVDFTVKVEAFEQLLPEKKVTSYATGGRDIKNAYIAFKVEDKANELIYYPFFSESLGRELVKMWGLELPRKMTIFVTEGENGGSGGKSAGLPRKEDNKKMLQLILYARYMMILYVSEPEPMYGTFKEIYDKLYQNPDASVDPKDIKKVNSAIFSYLNKKHQKFSNLQDFIKYLQCNYPESKLRDYDFDILREKLKALDLKEEIVF